MHQIGEVAERVGLSLRTARYYEEVGLITPDAPADKLLELARYAEKRCQKLREHLAAGERLAAELSREARSASVNRA